MVSMDLSSMLVFESERRRREKNQVVSKGDILYEAFVAWLKKTDRAVYDDYVGRGLIR